MEISLRPGEGLRIENEDGSVLTVSVPPGAGLWEIRAASVIRRALLTDIGLARTREIPGSARPLLRQQELRRIEISRLGLV